MILLHCQPIFCHCHFLLHGELKRRGGQQSLHHPSSAKQHLSGQRLHPHVKLEGLMSQGLPSLELEIRHSMVDRNPHTFPFGSRVSVSLMTCEKWLNTRLSYFDKWVLTAHSIKAASAFARCSCKVIEEFQLILRVLLLSFLDFQNPACTAKTATSSCFGVRI